MKADKWLSAAISIQAAYLLIGLNLAESSALAATVIEQVVDVSIDQKKAQSLQRWSISDNKFVLQVKSGSGGSTAANGDDETRYIFNGRNFYACGKLNQAMVAATKGISDPKIFASYKEGTCLVVPTNFMVRFFLSPIPSVTSVDRSDGMRLTLGLKNYDLQPMSKQQNAFGHTCNIYSRRFAVTKSTGKGTSASTTVTEEFCEDDALNWRQGIWNEVAKAVIRQPHGSEILKTLKTDVQGIKGLVLSSDSQQTTVDLSGKHHTHHVVVKTTSIQEVTLSPGMFALPDGYKIFSDDSALLAATTKDSKSSATPAADSQSIIDLMSSVIFCALSGPLACLAAP
jgi:hypothetical protein